MIEDPYEKEGYVYVFDYNLGQPIYYTTEEYAAIQLEQGIKRKKSRLQTLEAYLIALDNIDTVVRIIKTSKTTRDAKKTLISALNITQKQASAILQLKIDKLTKMNHEEIKEEYKKL
ncbi:DNA gyrase subunit A [Butyrivibrio sp. AE3004]|uniref:DNA gyrase subunit A n=1 Tax=Butyrivibrio sp. AE3004 TaxID=1506994 RepID=UPI000493F3DD|nr:DNA gyrase subunit A [Butyrivibrio sp. AE3004]